MEIVSDQTHRVLAYLDALNRHGVALNAGLLDEFASSPDQKRGRTGGMIGGDEWTSFFDNLMYGKLGPKEKFSQYLSRCGWVSGTHDELSLTPVGKALLRALDAPALEGDPPLVEVVLDPADPFAYASAIEAIGRAEQSMLVDPYFRLDQFADIVTLGSVSRVLVGPGLKKREYLVLSKALEAKAEDHQLEIRVADKLHDRYVIPDEGSVLMLGTSLAGIGKKLSTITSLGEIGSEAIRQAHEALWADAKPLPAGEIHSQDNETSSP